MYPDQRVKVYGPTTAASRATVAGDGESFAVIAHDIFLRLKNKKLITGGEGGKEVPKNLPTLLTSLIDLVQIVGDWVIDLVIAAFHFYQGRYFVGTLTLFFIFVGGLFVNFSLNFLMKRKGDEEFKEELKKVSPLLPYLIHVPSFLPFFSIGMQVYFVNKLRKLDPAIDKLEFERVQKLVDICEDHFVTDLLYESSYESHPQAILQIITLVEKPFYKSIFDFLPLVGVLIAWYSIAMTPIKLAKKMNNVQVKWTEVVAGLANKAVTLLSFSLFIAASRKYYADPWTVDSDLVVATILSILALSFFSEIPGLVTFHLELRQMKKIKMLRMKKDWAIIVNLISLVIPITAIIYWTLAMYYTGDLGKVRVIVLTALFSIVFVIAFVGFFAHQQLKWLGQFSTDILLLLYIGFYSHFKSIEFRKIDFNYDGHQEESQSAMMTSLPILNESGSEEK